MGIPLLSTDTGRLLLHLPDASENHDLSPGASRSATREAAELHWRPKEPPST